MQFTFILRTKCIGYRAHDALLQVTVRVPVGARHARDLYKAEAPRNKSKPTCRSALPSGGIETCARFPPKARANRRAVRCVRHPADPAIFHNPFVIIGKIFPKNISKSKLDHRPFNDLIIKYAQTAAVPNPWNRSCGTGNGMSSLADGSGPPRQDQTGDRIARH